MTNQDINDILDAIRKYNKFDVVKLDTSLDLYEWYRYLNKCSWSIERDKALEILEKELEKELKNKRTKSWSKRFYSLISNYTRKKKDLNTYRRRTMREEYDTFKEVAIAAKEAKKEFVAAIKNKYDFIEYVTVYSYTNIRFNTAYHSVDFYADRTEEAEIEKLCDIDMQSIETEEEALEYFRKVKEDREALEIMLRKLRDKCGGGLK